MRAAILGVLLVACGTDAGSDDPMPDARPIPDFKRAAEEVLCHRGGPYDLNLVCQVGCAGTLVGQGQVLDCDSWLAYDPRGSSTEATSYCFGRATDWEGYAGCCEGRSADPSRGLRERVVWKKCVPR